MNEDKEHEVLDSPVAEEVVKSSKKDSSTNKAQVRIVEGYERDGCVICLAGDGTGYLVPVHYVRELADPVLTIDLADKQIKVLYNWTKEIEAMLPSKTEMVATIRKALWLNGAHNRESLKLGAVQRNLMRGAFPYIIKIEEE